MKIKSTLLLYAVICINAVASNAQSQGDFQNFKSQKIGIVISSNDPETVWNAFRLANYAAEQADTVSVFLLGKGVEAPDISNGDFDVKGMMETFSNNRGNIFACGTCLQMRNKEGSKICPVSSLSDLYAIIKSNEIVLTF